MGREVLEWIDVALVGGHVAGCHELNAHLRSKNARGFLGSLRIYWLPQKILDSSSKKALEYQIS
jgi:hypothetical protein